jgi:hypothetical protein
MSLYQFYYPSVSKPPNQQKGTHFHGRPFVVFTETYIYVSFRFWRRRIFRRFLVARFLCCFCHLLHCLDFLQLIVVVDSILIAECGGCFCHIINECQHGNQVNTAQDAVRPSLVNDFRELGVRRITLFVSPQLIQHDKQRQLRW